MAVFALQAVGLGMFSFSTLAQEPLKVSSFSTVLTEIAEQVGGAKVQVSSHVAPGVDPHEYEPKPGVLKVASSADVVLLSAKHLEGFVGKLQQVVGPNVHMLAVGDRIPSLLIKTEAGTLERVDDPHWWHSVENMQKAVRIVRDEFSKLRPESRSYYEANAQKYGKELGELKEWALGKVAELPRDRRKLVTSHEAFQYFAKEYGFTIYSVEGLTPSDQPSSRKVAELLSIIRAQKVKAVFSQDSANPKVLKQITAETGAILGPSLWADGLGTGDAGTYSGMFRHNVNAIVGGLK